MHSPIKMIGSKIKLISPILKKLPNNYNKYYELFAGTAAILFELQPKSAIVSDLNSELINFYEVLKNNVEDLITEVSKLSINETTYYDLRKLDRTGLENLTNLQRAVRFLYLNKTCYNGVYRVNSKGFFNVPFNKKTSINFNFDLLRETSCFLKNVTFFNNDFECFLPLIQKNDLVYLDPPYADNENSGKSSYTKNNFDINEQVRLADFCKILHKKHAYFILSNSESQQVIDLYKDFQIETVVTRRFVGPTAETRKLVKELIICNSF
jgi:DNA adenine methylase